MQQLLGIRRPSVDEVIMAIQFMSGLSKEDLVRIEFFIALFSECSHYALYSTLVQLQLCEVQARQVS
jgi:hypothetical protein